MIHWRAGSLSLLIIVEGWNKNGECVIWEDTYFSGRIWRKSTNMKLLGGDQHIARVCLFDAYRWWVRINLDHCQLPALEEDMLMQACLEGACKLSWTNPLYYHKEVFHLYSQCLTSYWLTTAYESPTAWHVETLKELTPVD